jgi:cytochrome P450
LSEVNEMTQTGAVAAQLTAETLYDNPYPIYASLRRDSPVHFFPTTGEYLVTRWKDCFTVGTKDSIFVPSDSSRRPEARVMGLPNILSMSGPPHAALRKGIDANLTAGAVGTYAEGLVRPIAREYVESLRSRGAADLTRDLFEPISVRVVATVLGMSHVDNQTLVRWFHALNGGLQNAANDPAVWAVCDTARAEIDSVVRPIIERVTREPDESIISHMVHGGLPEGQVRGFDDLMPTIRVTLLGGLQEPGHGAANAVYGLLSNPEQSALVAKDPAQFAQAAYDEGLRWIAPIGVTPRLASEEFELAGTLIPKGASVAIVLASANRDESRYENGEEFHLQRPVQPHAAFGYRRHVCSGQNLSRVIGRVSIQETYRLLPNLRLDPHRQVVTKGWRFRGVMNLPVLWNA